METDPVRMFVRMTLEGLAQAKAFADSMDMTLSELVRMLLQATGLDADPSPRNTSRRLTS